MELLDGLDLESLVVQDGPQPAGPRDQADDPGVRLARRSARRRPVPPRHQAAEPVHVPRRRRGRHHQAARLRHRPDDQRDAGAAAHQRAHARADPVCDVGPSSRRSARCSARPASWRPSRSSACRSTVAPISTRSAASRGGCSPAARSSRARASTRRSSTSTSTRRSRRCAQKMRGWCPPSSRPSSTRCSRRMPPIARANARDLAAMLRAIPIPPEHAWTEAKARAWWAAYKPAVLPHRRRRSEVQVIMPGSTSSAPTVRTEGTTRGPTIRRALATKPAPALCAQRRPSEAVRARSRRACRGSRVPDRYRRRLRACPTRTSNHDQPTPKFLS